MVFVPSWGTEGKIVRYNGVPTEGFGVACIMRAGRLEGQTGAVTVSDYLVDHTAQDGTFEVMANVLVTTAGNHDFTIQVTYTDEGNTTRTFILATFLLKTTLGPDNNYTFGHIKDQDGAVPHTTQPVTIRAKDNTHIMIFTTGSFSNVVYNFEGMIKQVA